MVNTSWLTGILLWELARYLKAVFPEQSPEADLYEHFFEKDLVMGEFSKAVKSPENNRAAEIISRASEFSFGNIEEKADTDKKIPALVSVLSTLPITGKHKTEKWYHKLHSFEKAVFFSEEPFLGDQLKEHLKKLIEELAFLVRENSHDHPDTIITLVEKYGNCLPVLGAPAGSDIPLANVSKMAAAIVACWESDENGVPIIPEINEDGYTLLQGDLSGIQNYIYRIASARGVAKGLKGRSFEVSLISDTVICFLLKKYQMFRTQIIYNSGGGFLLLLPQKAINDLPQISAAVEKACFDRYDGEIYLALGAAEITGKDLTAKGFSDARRKVRDLSNHVKRRKFSTVIADDYSAVFGVKGIGKTQPNCDMCGREENDTTDLKELTDPEGRKRKLCGQCINLEDAGKFLSRANFLVEVVGEEKAITKGVARLSPLPLKEEAGIPAINYYIVPENKMPEFTGQAMRYIKLGMPAFNKQFPLINELKHKNASFDYRFYGGNDLPEKKSGEPLNYDELAEMSQGVKRLGILRMDVDNLGLVFRGGNKMPPDTNAQAMPPARLAALSNLMDRFFANHVSELRSSDKFKNSVMIVYSGGDDLFAVGSWDKLISFGSLLQQRFVNFVGNKNLTLSGGMAMASKKFPIHRAADIAGDAESAAKSYNPETKDAFTFLDKPLRWEDFRIAESISKELTGAISNASDETSPLNKGILDRLRRIFSLYEENRRQKERLHRKGDIGREDYQEMVLYDKWRWRLTYTMSRFARNNKQYAQLVEDIQLALLKDEWERTPREVSKRNIIDFIDVAARWAEFLTRIDNKNN